MADPVPEPPKRDWQAIGFVFVLGISLAANAFFIYDRRQGGNPVPVPVAAVDKAFIPVGKDLGRHVLNSYAAGWDDGANELDKHKMVPGLDMVKTSWDAQRQTDYNEIITPKFAEIIPIGTPDDQVTSSQWTRMQAAWRGIAQGLRL